MPEPADRRDRRVYVWWAAGLGLLLALGLFCWLLLAPFVQTRAAVDRCEAATHRSELEVQALGGPGAAAGRLALYLRVPRCLAPNRPTAAALLGYCGEAGSTRLLPLLADEAEDPDVRVRAARALGLLGEGRALEPLIAAMQDPRREFTEPIKDGSGWYSYKQGSTLAQAAAISLGHLRNPRAVEPLISALREGRSGAREAVVLALGWIGDPRAVEPLLEVLDNKAGESWDARGAAAQGLGGLKDRRAFESLVAALADPEDDPTYRRIHRSAAEALGDLGDARAVKPLIAALEDSAPYVRAYAARSLGMLKSAEAIGPLAKLQEDPDEKARSAAASALKKIRGEQAGK